MLLHSYCLHSALVAFIASTTQCVASAVCHSPDGTISPLDQPCYPSASDSFCCPPSSICSSNKLCTLPGGQPLRGSCTDPSFASEACPQFCLHRGAGLRHSASLNMTLCETDPHSTVYCCNQGNGEACDCSAKSSRKVRLNLFNPVTTISAAGPSVPSASMVSIKISSGAAATSTSSRFLQRPVHQADRWLLPWKTLGPILLAVLVMLFAASMLYLVRHACLTKRQRESRRASAAVESGQGRRYSDWAVYWDDNGAKAKSKFSIGSLDSDISPLDNGKALRPRRDAVNSLQVSTHLSPKDDGLRRRKSDEHKKSSLDVGLEHSLQEPYLGRQRCESVVSESARDSMSVAKEQRKMSKIGEQPKMGKIEERQEMSRVDEQQKETTQITANRTLQEMLNSPFLGRQNSVF